MEVGLPFEEALMRTRAALAAQGFGVLTEIDVAATLRAEIGPEVPPQIILGACNPPLAHRALQPKPDIGLLLPCNVVVRVDADGVTRISAMDHDVVVALTRQAALRPVATEARDGLASARSRTARRVGEARPAGGGRRGDDESCLTAGRFRASLRIARPAGCAGRRSRNAGDVGRHPCRPAPSILWGTGCRRGERAAVVTEGETGTAIPGTSGGRIIVGVDGPPGGRAALVWALAAGARAGAEVQVVSAVPVDPWSPLDVIGTSTVEQVRADTEARLWASVAEAMSDPAVRAVARERAVPVHVTVTPGGPAEALVARAEGAGLLVVGSRGRGAVRSALLGSVALHCTARRTRRARSSSSTPGRRRRPGWWWGSTTPRWRTLP